MKNRSENSLPIGALHYARLIQRHRELEDRVRKLETLIPAYLEMKEITIPAAGPTNTARVYAVDNGAGKTSLRVRFATGAAQTIATEP